MAKSNIPCVILAGGNSRRFGSPKGLAKLGDKILLDIIYTTLRLQTDGPIWLNASLDGPYKDCGFELVPDIMEKKGPLAGIHAGMLHAQRAGYSSLMTVPIDTPFLPANLIEKLEQHPAPVIAKSLERLHPVIGIWPIFLAKNLKIYIAQGNLAVKDWTKNLDIGNVDFLPVKNLDPFWNINSPNDLKLPANGGGD